MKKGLIIALCVLLVLGAGAGFAYYRLYSTAQDAEQMQRTIFEQYEAMLQNAEQTTLTVTENGETVGVRLGFSMRRSRQSQPGLRRMNA